MIGSQYSDSLNATPAASNVFVFELNVYQTSGQWKRTPIYAALTFSSGVRLTWICKSWQRQVLIPRLRKRDAVTMTPSTLSQQDFSCLKGIPVPSNMGFALTCFNLILATLALAELRIPEKELANLQLGRLQQEAELVDLVTLPEECQRWVSSWSDSNFSLNALGHISVWRLSLLPEATAQSILIHFVWGVSLLGGGCLRRPWKWERDCGDFPFSPHCDPLQEAGWRPPRRGKRVIPCPHAKTGVELSASRRRCPKQGPAGLLSCTSSKVWIFEGASESWKWWRYSRRKP